MPGSAVEAKLVVGGYAWANWTRYELDADYTTPADAWSFEVHNPSHAQLAALTTGSAIQVLVGDQVAQKGFLERRQARRAKDGGTVIALSGRDLGAPLLDCTPKASWIWRNVSLESLAKQALAELGVTATVSAHADAKTLRSVQKAEPGETYWQVIERYAKKLRLLPWMSPAGVLHLDRPDYTSEPVATLIHGRTSYASQTNVIEFVHDEDLAGRYSDVTVVGQVPGNDSLFGSAACQVKGTAKDAGMAAKGLYRPTVMDDGDVASSTEASARAAWEVSHRQYEAQSLQVVVPGHGPTSMTLWELNTQVTVVDEVFGTSGTWWIAGRRLLRDRKGGSRSALTLRVPGALLPAVA